MANTISNMDDMIDVRDVIARIEELEEGQDHDKASSADDLANWKEEYGAELASLEKLMAELKDCNGGDEHWRGDWYPITMIRDSYFVDAMQELCEDIGDFPNGVPSYYVIDWEATARNLQQDYTSVEFDGVTYWVR